MPPEPRRTELGKTLEPFGAGRSFCPPNDWPWRFQLCRSFRPLATFTCDIDGGAEFHEYFLMSVRGNVGGGQNTPE
jgi:hypothetical protein